MNKIYKVIWCKATQTMVAVSEFAKSKGKNSSRLGGGSSPRFKLAKLSVVLMLTLSGQAVAGSVAVGRNENSYATGNAERGNASAAADAVAVGDGAKASQKGGVAIGKSAKAGDASNSASTFAIAVGVNSFAKTNQSIAIGSAESDGEGAQATGDQAVAIGGNTSAQGDSSIAIGGDDTDKAVGRSVKYKITVIKNGVSTDSTKTKTIADIYTELTGDDLQKMTHADNDLDSTGKFGVYRNTRAGHAAIAIGDKAYAVGELGVAYGTGATVDDVAVAGTAIGAGAKSTKINGVALGAGSRTDLDAQLRKNAEVQVLDAYGNAIPGETVTFNGFTGGAENLQSGDQVSVGAKGFERQIKNVAAGWVNRKSTDAINGSQLATVAGALKGEIAKAGKNTPFEYVDAQNKPVDKLDDGHYYKANSVVINPNGNKAYLAGTVLGADGKGYQQGTVVYNGNPYPAGSVVSGGNVYPAGTRFKSDGTPIDVNGATVTPITSDPSLEITEADRVSAITSLKKNPNTVVIHAKSDASNAPKRVTNVAAGVEDTDAVNVSQIKNYFHTNATNSAATGNATNLDLVNGIGGAKGAYSVAAGVETQSIGKQSVAVGYKSEAKAGESIAIGPKAIAEVAGSIAIGAEAHANTHIESIAIGKKTKAVGKQSIAFGNDVRAKGERAIVVGSRSFNNLVDVEADATTGNFAIAIGAGEGKGKQTDPNKIIATDPEGKDNIAIVKGDYGIAFGTTSRVNEMEGVAIGRQAKSDHEGAVALGSGSETKVAVGVSQAVVGDVTYDGSKFAGKTPASVVSFGTVGKERQLVNVAAGEISETSTDAINGSQLYSITKTLQENSSQGSKKNYFHTNTSSSAVVGNATNLDSVDGVGGAKGGYSIAAGVNAQATGNYGSMALGYRSKALEDGAIAVGTDAVSKGTSSVSIGYGSAASGTGSMSLGRMTKTLGSSVAIGNQADARSTSVAIGNLANAQSTGVAIGNSSKAVSAGFAMGNNAKTTGERNVSIGNYAEANSVQSMAIGQGAWAKSIESLAIGSFTHAYGEQAVAIGNDVFANGKHSTVIGTRWIGSGSVENGHDGQAKATATDGDFSIAIGSGIGSHTQKSMRKDQVAESDANYGIALGTSSRTEKNAEASVAIGRLSQARVEGGVAIGSDSIANRQSIDSTNVITDEAIVITADDQTGIETANKVYALGVADDTDKNNIKETVKGGLGAVSVGTVTRTFKTRAAGVQYDGSGNPVAGSDLPSEEFDIEIATRQIINVAAGSADTDAVNVAQLKAVANVAKKNAEVKNYVHVNSTGVNQTASGNTNTANLDSVDGTGGAYGVGAIAIGMNAQAKGNLSVVIGGNGSNDATGYSAVVLGRDNKALADDTFVSGRSNTASGKSATAMGYKSKAAGKGAFAAGGYYKNDSSPDAGVKGGQALSDGSIALGGDTVAGENNGNQEAVAIGYRAKALKDKSLALGFNATANHANSVALGEQSETKAAVDIDEAIVGEIKYSGFAGEPNGVVSIGNVGAEKQIVNVAAGEISDTSTDAINGSQLYATNVAIDNVVKSVKTNFGGDAYISEDGWCW